jgi:hypothetical protein
LENILAATGSFASIERTTFGSDSKYVLLESLLIVDDYPSAMDHFLSSVEWKTMAMSVWAA